MIQFFRQNNFLTTLLIIPYVFIVRMACFYLNQEPQPMDTGGILYSVFQSAFENRPVFSHIVINFIIGFTAILVNRVVIKHRLTRYQSLIPGIVYVFLVSWLESFLAFTAIHIANFFVVIGILSVFKFSKKMSYSIVIFDGAFYFALAALFYTPYILYVIPALFGFMSLDRFGAREFANALVGVLVPFFIVSGLVYFYQQDYSLLDGYGLNKTVFSWFKETSLIDLVPLILYAMILMIVIISYASISKKTTLVVQKKINILYWFLLTSFLTIFFINEKNVENLLVLAIPSSIICGMLIERTKAPALEEFFHLALLGGILFLHFNQSVNILM